VRSLIAGKYARGGKLPSEPELARRLGISRPTLRQALARLAREGLILRRRGAGTFVNPSVLNIQTRLEEVWDFVEMIRLAGYEPGVKHAWLTLGVADASVAEKLALSPGSEVLTTANVFLADGTPVIYCVDVIPANLVQQAYLPEELYGPVYRFLDRRCGQRVEYNITDVRPVVADQGLSDLLDCPRGAPLHYFEEVAYNKESLPIMYSEEYYRPEYFSFKVVRQMITASPAQGRGQAGEASRTRQVGPEGMEGGRDGRHERS